MNAISVMLVIQEKRKYLFIRKYTQCPDFAKELL